MDRKISSESKEMENKDEMEIRDTMENRYEHLIAKYEQEVRRQQKRSNGIGMGKLALVFALVVDIFFLFESKKDGPWWIAAGLLLLYGISARYHSKVLEEIAHKSYLCQTARKNIARMNGTWTKFEDIGEEYVDYEHNYATDLDVVGESSLFQYLNVTNTYYGRQCLAKDLLHPAYEIPELEQRQEAIKELSGNYELTSELEYLFSKVGVDVSFPELLEEMERDSTYLRWHGMRTLLRLFWCAVVVSVLLAVVLRTDSAFYLASGMVFVQGLLSLAGSKKNRSYTAPLYRMTAKLFPYVPVLTLLMETEFASQKLQGMQQSLRGQQIALKRLARIAENVKQTKNVIAAFLLNLLFLWSYKNTFDFEAWRKQYGAEIRTCFVVLGELESLLSFTNLNRNCSRICKPELVEQRFCLKGKSIGHPLIQYEKRRDNDFTMEQKINMISGSNMSGKSTFMRTIGMNMVLANAGSYVCADQLETCLWQPVTSMRIVDSTQEGISTFYSELLRIKKLLDYTKADENAFFLIDEIFRGTNSVDRLKGAQEVVKKLLELHSYGIITTHDLELCKMEQESGEVKNYSFYEEYRDGEMYFDYRIKEGISKTTNAEFLLRKIGIIE